MVAYPRLRVSLCTFNGYAIFQDGLANNNVRMVTSEESQTINYRISMVTCALVCTDIATSRER
jgi:hypothetical protein